MYSFLTNNVNDRYNQMLAGANRVSTFCMSLDSHEQRLKKMRTKVMWSMEFARADHDIKGMPVLLIAEGGHKNRVVVQTPNGLFADVTEATEQEVTQLSMGLAPAVQPKVEEAKPAAESFGEALGGILGLVLLCALDARKSK